MCLVVEHCMNEFSFADLLHMSYCIDPKRTRLKNCHSLENECKQSYDTVNITGLQLDSYRNFRWKKIVLFYLLSMYAFNYDCIIQVYNDLWNHSSFWFGRWDFNDDENGDWWVAKKNPSVISERKLVQWPCSVYVRLIVGLGFFRDSPIRHQTGSYNQERILDSVNVFTDGAISRLVPVCMIGSFRPWRNCSTIQGFWLAKRILRKSKNSPWHNCIHSCFWATTASLWQQD